MVLFNMLSRLVIGFLLRSKHLLISWLKSLNICSDFGAPQNKVFHLFPIVSPSICHEVMGPDAMIFIFWMLSFKPKRDPLELTKRGPLTKCGPLEMGMANQYSCLENPMNSMKRKKDRTLKDDFPRSVGAQYATGDQWRNNSRNNEETEPKQNP